MKIDLKKYFEERDRINQVLSVPGPFITFSRQYGCEAERISRLLIQHLNDLPDTSFKKVPWKYISKEILDESAKELGLTANDVDHRIQLHHSDVVNHIFSSFSHHYDVADRIIQNKVKEIILTYAKKGNVVIIGRGGSSVTREMENGLRIKLIAPFEWRVQEIVKRMSVSKRQASDLIKHFDENRLKWIEHLTDEPYDDSIFDFIINVAKFSDQEIVKLIRQIMRNKGLIGDENVWKKKLSKIVA